MVSKKEVNPEWVNKILELNKEEPKAPQTQNEES